MATAKTIEHATVRMEAAMADLLRRAKNIGPDAAWYEVRDFLGAAREYGRTVNRLTRVRSTR